MDYMETIKQASGDAWTLFKAYIGIKNDDAEWEKFQADAQKIYKKYEGTQAENYVRHYITSVVENEIERVSKL